MQGDQQGSPVSIEIEEGLSREISSAALLESKSKQQIKDETNQKHWNSFERIFKSRIQQVLKRSNILLILFTAFSSFCAYFANYGLAVFVFARTYSNQTAFGMQLKVAFTISQIVGYGLSKVAATLILPTLGRQYRCRILTVGALLAEIPLEFFGFLNENLQVFMVFLNGIPLAWTWGLMVMYLEGRRSSELLIISLYLSVMVASGTSKTLAISTINAGLDEKWMPAVCGAISCVVCIVCFNMLDSIPEPTDFDVSLRNERQPITNEQRSAFFRKWWFGLFSVTIVYSFLSAIRNFRDYFTPEIFQELLGEDFDATVFTETELPIGLATTTAFAFMYIIKDDRKGFFVLLSLMIFGGALIGISTLLFYFNYISPFAWIILAGAGIFIAYIPPGASFYDRLNGATGSTFTSVFMMYFSDLFGYSATLATLLYRNFGPPEVSYVNFFENFAFGVSIFSVVCLSLSFIYFYVHLPKQNSQISKNVIELDIKEKD